MSDDKQPPERATTQLPAVPDWAIELTKSMKSGFTNVNTRLDGIETHQDVQRAHVTDLSLRLTGLDNRMVRVEDRATSNSLRAKGTSEVDLKHEAELARMAVSVTEVVGVVAEIVKKVDTIEVKTDVQTAFLARAETAASKLAANPIVRSIAVMLGTAILTWLAAHGGVR